jgi:hypothetical protein
MDDFRGQQKRDSADGSQRGVRRPYGCRCCRDISGLALHKRVSRRRARVRLAEITRREMHNRIEGN